MTTDPNQALDGATTALQRRIEELTAKLAEWQRVFDFIDPNEALDDCATKLATERAAREQAERDYDRMLEQAHTARVVAKQAERERDTALARVKELEQRPDECDNCGTTIDGDKAATSDVCYDCWKAAETALASARELLSGWHDYVLSLQQGARCFSGKYNVSLILEDIIARVRSDELTLTAHPAPVAAVALPPDGPEGMVGGRSLPRPAAATAQSAEAYAEKLAKASAMAIAAPCAGCAELKAKLVRARNILRTDGVYVDVVARALEAIR